MRLSVVRLCNNLVAMVKKIGTHDGKFHADEALACFMLKQLPEYKDAQVVRTRDESILATCDVVVDVGAKFDPATHRYDHHQREFQETMRTLANLPYDTRLSSAGLVYCHFGKRVLHEALRIPLDSANLDLVFERVYANFVEEMDGVDNGVEAFDGKARYKVSTTLGSRVSRLFPAWNCEDAVDIDGQFHKAMHLCGTEFLDSASYVFNSWLPAREIVKEAIKNREQVSHTGRVLMLENGGVPWKEHMFNIEKELDIEGRMLFAIYKDEKGMFRVQAVPKSSTEGFSNRLPLPEAWRGVRNEELVTVSGIQGATFCHASGFIGGNKTKEGALEMAEKTIQMDADKKLLHVIEDSPEK